MPRWQQAALMFCSASATEHNRSNLILADTSWCQALVLMCPIVPGGLPNLELTFFSDATPHCYAALACLLYGVRRATGLAVQRRCHCSYGMGTNTRRCAYNGTALAVRMILLVLPSTRTGNMRTDRPARLVPPGAQALRRSSTLGGMDTW